MFPFILISGLFSLVRNIFSIFSFTFIHFPYCLVEESMAAIFMMFYNFVSECFLNS